MLNAAGEVAEGAGSNVFVVEDGVVLTPPLAAGILAGITREVLLELAAGARSPRSRGAPDACRTCSRPTRPSSPAPSRRHAPIRTVDGKPVGAGRPGPVTLRILAAFREYAPRYCG